MDSFAAEFNFVNEPPNDQLCPVCIELMMQPFLTDCGHYLCYTCRGRLLASGKDECPECREPNGAKDARLNKHLQRQVNSLMVRCQHHEVGCQWVGEMRYLKEHLDPLLRRCGFILLACPFGCGERVRSSAMEEHISRHCSKRLCACEYCGYYSSHDIVTNMHYPVCDLFPVKCPNKCSINMLKRMQLEMHLEEQCPLQVIQCPFTSAGCTVQLPRRELEEHEDKAMRQHLRMVMSLHTKPPLTGPCSSQLYLFSLTPLEFTIGDFLKMKQSNSEWVSPPFYTHPRGYKLCLVVYPNGRDIGIGSHVSVFVGLLKGEHDDQLAWPLELDVTIELLNWREDKRHHKLTLTMNSECYLVSKNGIKLSPNGLQFIHHSFLSSTNTEYLRKNSLRLRLKTATIQSHATSAVVIPPDHNAAVCDIIMTEFAKRKQSNNAFYSSSFYTHQQGYKMCLRVHANGHKDAKDTHVSVFAFIMAGDYDEQLQWPFVGDIVLELVNWREDKGHQSMTLSINVLSHFYKVTEGSAGYSFGFGEFISQSALPYDRSTNTQYLCNDSLRLRVKQIAVYSTPLLLKIPTWQNLRNVSQSMYEFTLTEFSKRRKFGNSFDTTPFYTHRHGYKLCLSVYAEGCERGDNTHVSVFVVILAGEHDDELRWPLVGDIDIMLLNWQKDKKHHKKTISICFGRVLEGVLGRSMGYSRFISHSSLPYNYSTNTAYLQDDCLRFRVNMHK